MLPAIAQPSEANASIARLTSTTGRRPSASDQRLLNREFQRNGVERREVRVDRKRTEHRKRRQQHGE